MATKLSKSLFPSGHGPNDFECFGPPALKDGEFSGTRIADMGCFTQDGKDSNKGYHAAVVKSRKTGQWYAYFEWGRTGGTPDFQFVQCSDESEAQNAYEKQCHAKNDKRGEWVKVAGIDTLRAKKGKDCYLVRPQHTRSTGLPDAKSIQSNDAPKNATVKKAKKKAGKKAKPDVDPQTAKLLRDMGQGVVSYTRGQMADDSLPTQTAIDEARQILSEAQQRVGKLPDDTAAQVKDKKLKEFTSVLYSRIPKEKKVGAADHTWILSEDNILLWQQDLDAFEQALVTVSHDVDEAHPLDGMDLEMEWIDPRGKDGKWIVDFAKNASRNRHGYVGAMQIKNLWRVRKPSLERGFDACQGRIAKTKFSSRENPMFAPKGRPDLNSTKQKVYNDSKTALLFHGTRSVNVTGILTKSLMLPKQLVGVAITGAMFGPGLYFADDWKKSAGYCSIGNSFWAGGSGKVRGRSAFMFLVDTVLGKPHVAPRASGYTKAPDGHHSVFGKAGHSHVQNNEWIVYDTNQHFLRYLIEFDA